MENFSEETGVLQGMKVCSMSENERKGEDKSHEPKEGVAKVKKKSLAEDTENKTFSFFRHRVGLTDNTPETTATENH